MTNAEFSDAFDTLLNSYSVQAQFGEGASKFEVTLDEYEKSVFLTQAQDQIVKSYFDARLNSTQEGMDTSERRQVDFSSLIRVTLPERICNTENSIVTSEFKELTFSLSNSPGKVIAANICGERLEATQQYLALLLALGTGGKDNHLEDIPLNAPYMVAYIAGIYFVWIMPDSGKTGGSSSSSEDHLWKVLDPNKVYTFDNPSYYLNKGVPVLSGLTMKYTDDLMDRGNPQATEDWGTETVFESTLRSVRANLKTLVNRNTYGIQYDCRTYQYQLPSDILFVLNEKLVAYTLDTPVTHKEFVVKPINYKEYDREMSKAYGQPLKKQVWRIFQNLGTGYDITSEIIPGEILSELESSTSRVTFEYKLRYIKRPTPIVLVDLPNDLNIDGVSNETPCSLNPILHMDILNLAVQLALTTRGARQPRNNNDKES